MTQFVEWTSKLSVNIQEIDEQHKTLIHLINCLYNETIVKTAEPNTLRDIVIKLAHYTLVHFSIEESLFRLLDYPQYQQHKKQHDHFKQTVYQIQGELDGGEETINIDLIMFLKKWLNNHIKVSDAAYTDFLLSKGLNATWSDPTWKEHIAIAIQPHEMGSDSN